jgi:hypothetical protein
MRRIRANESGMALVTVLLALGLLTAIGAALTAIGIVEFRASLNHRSASRALMLADAGATHAVALLRGPVNTYSYTDVLLGADGLEDTDDDGLFVGFELTGSDVLPDTGIVLGGGRYYVKMVNDDEDPSGNPHSDSNHRFVALCRGETPDGGVAEVRVMLAAPTYPAIATNGTLFLPGTPDVVGACGGVHANKVVSISGHPIVSGDGTFSDTVIMSGTITNPFGDIVVPHYAPPVDVPDYDPTDFCDGADYRLVDGKLIDAPPRESQHFLGKVLGWQYDALTGTYQLNANDAVEGKVCVNGNVKIIGNLGDPGDPFEITIIATGSVQVGGIPIIEPVDDDDILILAGGDVTIGGTTTGSRSPYYAGLIYARSQCQINGTPYVDGHVLCYDGPDPAGAINVTDDNKINGTPTISYDCSGDRRRTLVAAWWESRTS